MIVAGIKISRRLPDSSVVMGFFLYSGRPGGCGNRFMRMIWHKHAFWRLGQPITFNRSYNLSGGEILTYRQMVEKIFSSLGKPIRFFLVPAWLFRLGIQAIMLFPGKRSITPEMAVRMNTDLCFPHADATKDFGFMPRPFSPAFGQQENPWK